MPHSVTAIQPDALADAMLLATTGGLLDAIVYLNHGHVFANAMSGNVVFLAIAILGRDWKDIVPHLIPLAGFFAGINTSKHLRTRLGRFVLLGLGLEIAAIFVLGWLPDSFPKMAFTGIIAYVGAIQVASFRRVDRFAYNSTFITGNLRDVAEGFYDAFDPGVTPETRERGLSRRPVPLVSSVSAFSPSRCGRMGGASFRKPFPLVRRTLPHRRHHTLAPPIDNAYLTAALTLALKN
jgi:uncharacterized membrane protein YoaK (UPF0700 family)